MDKKSMRSSNFELLRILAMFMIILFHIQLHGPQNHLNDGIFSSPVFLKKFLILEFGVPLGMIGNGLFFMISGYFMANNLHIDIAKTSKKLLLEIGFATIVLTLASAIVITGNGHELGTRNVAGVDLFNNAWWFPGYYLLVIVFAKIFLNKFLANLDAKGYGAFLLVLFAVDQLQWSGAVAENLVGGLRVLMIGTFFFALGGYIKLYNPFKNIRLYAIFLVIIVTYALRFITSYNTTMKNIESYISGGENAGFIQSVHSSTNYEITVVILGVCIFEIFRRISIPNNKVINYLGKATLMIYFIHENPLFISFYTNDQWMETLSKSSYQYVCKWLYWALISFVIGVIAYSVFELFSKLCNRCKWLFVKKRD